MSRSKEPIDRRLCFRYFARDTMAWVEEVFGKPQVQLTDLPTLPAEVLGELIPQVCPGVRILPQETRVCGRLEGANETLTLFSRNNANLFVFNRFNGQQTLGAIARELGAEMNWPCDRAFVYVRGLFFRLVGLRVCVPANDLPTGTSA